MNRAGARVPIDNARAATGPSDHIRIFDVVQHDWARGYINAVRWQFAKTMPQWPHEYTVRGWQPGRTIDFETMAAFTRGLGVTKAWPPDSAQPRYRHSYWELDGWEYWIMDGPVSETQVINRARLAGSGELAVRPRGG